MGWGTLINVGPDDILKIDVATAVYFYDKNYGISALIPSVAGGPIDAIQVNSKIDLGMKYVPGSKWANEIKIERYDEYGEVQNTSHYSVLHPANYSISNDQQIAMEEGSVSFRIVEVNQVLE